MVSTSDDEDDSPPVVRRSPRFQSTAGNGQLRQSAVASNSHQRSSAARNDNNPNGAIKERNSLNNRSKDPETNRFMNAAPSQLVGFLLGNLLWSRLILFAIVYLFGHFDFSTDAFVGLPRKENFSALDTMTRRWLTGYERWDALHLLHIAQYGYVYEQSLAFFPLFPYTVRLLAQSVFRPLATFGLLSARTVLVVAAVSLNFVLFVTAGALLFHVVRCLTDRVKVATLAVMFYAINPASIFFSAAYTESIYFTLTLLGLAAIVDNSNRPAALRYCIAVASFMLAALTRANGILNIGYIALFCVSTAWKNSNGRPALFRIFLLALAAIFTLAAYGAIVIPLQVHGTRQHRIFCHANASDVLPSALYEHGRHNGLVMPGDGGVQWCNTATTESLFVPLPSFYASVQRKYWQVEPFGYWRLKKAPLFALALPSLLLIVFGTLLVARRIFTEAESVSSWLSSGGGLVPYAVHCTILASGALCVYNVEVLTRMFFSSGPFAYIVLAQLAADGCARVRLSDTFHPRHLPFFGYYWQRGRLETAIVVWLVAYYSLGSAAHSAFLPFT